MPLRFTSNYSAKGHTLGKPRQVNQVNCNLADAPPKHDRKSHYDLETQMPDDEVLYDLADLFKVFADTTRVKILYALKDGELCVADIAETVGASQSAVSHQLRILKQSHLVKFERDGKNVNYSLADDHVLTILEQGMDHVCE